jgi:hypothetical protein
MKIQKKPSRRITLAKRIREAPELGTKDMLAVFGEAPPKQYTLVQEALCIAIRSKRGGSREKMIGHLLSRKSDHFARLFVEALAALNVEFFESIAECIRYEKAADSKGDGLRSFLCLLRHQQDFHNQRFTIARVKRALSLDVDERQIRRAAKDVGLKIYKDK